MRFPTNKTLGKIAVYGCIAGITSVMYMRMKIEERVHKSEYFREAFKILRSHKGAVQLLGEPIKECGFDLSNTEKNYASEEKAKFEVGVKGSKTRGVMFFWAEKSPEKWIVNRIELELKNEPNRRLLVKDTKATEK